LPAFPFGIGFGRFPQHGYFFFIQPFLDLVEIVALDNAFVMQALKPNGLRFFILEMMVGHMLIAQRACSLAAMPVCRRLAHVEGQIARLIERLDRG